MACPGGEALFCANFTCLCRAGWLFVELPGRGLEPLRISPPDPKSGASANFATLASLIYNDLQMIVSWIFLPVLEVVLELWREWN